MIIEHLIHFSLLVISQLLFFLFHAYMAGELRNVLFYLGRGMLLGLPFGIGFDLIIGKGVGMFEYELGFALWFLVINGIFSYGFMIANVFLLYKHSLLEMYLWSVGLAIIYEVTNYFVPVWTWTFGTPFLEFSVVILLAYAALTALMMCIMRLAFRFNFKLIPF